MTISTIVSSIVGILRLSILTRFLDKSDFGKPKDNPKVYTTDCPEGFELGNVYTVNIDLNGGEGKESIQVKEGSPIPEDAYPTKDGYEFYEDPADNADEL